MAVTLRAYEPHDFAALHRLDQACFPAGISYSKTTLHYFLTIPSADCIVAADGKQIAGFHFDGGKSAAGARDYTGRRGSTPAAWSWFGAARGEREESDAARRADPSCWKRQSKMKLLLPSGKGTAIVSRQCLKRYYLGRLDAFEMRKILPNDFRKFG